MNGSSEKESFWKFVLSEHVSSGLSISAFCRREGVSQASFYQWRKMLAGAVKPTPHADLATTSFVPVEIESADDEAGLIDQQAVAAHAAATLTIRTPDGYAVDVSASTPTDLIERSLRVLGQFHQFRSEIPS